MAVDLLNRSSHCVYRATQAEMLLTKEVAARAGLSASAYIRQSVLFMIMLEGNDEEVLAAISALGPECLPHVKSRLKYVKSLLND